MSVKRALGVIVIFVAVAAIALGIMAARSKSGPVGGVERSIVSLSKELLADTIPSGCFSECAYSTKAGSLDTVTVYKTQTAFNRWKSKCWDIPQTYPENWGQSMSEDRFKDGYVALVVAPSEMQDPDYLISAACKHTDPDGDIIVQLQQTKRNTSYSYRKDPSVACNQVYAIIYLKQNEVDAAGAISVGVWPAFEEDAA